MTVEQQPLVVSASALATIHWMVEKTTAEISAFGISDPDNPLHIVDFIIPKQQTSSASIDIDMEWWADYQFTLDDNNIDPSRVNTWFHTHPASMCSPSGTDQETMDKSFGNDPLAIMLITAHNYKSHAQLELNVTTPVQVRAYAYLEHNIPEGKKKFPKHSKDTIAKLDKIFEDRVDESRPVYITQPHYSSWGSSLPLQRTPLDHEFFEKFHQTKYYNAPIPKKTLQNYVKACNDLEIDPDNYALFWDTFGQSLSRHRTAFDKAVKKFPPTPSTTPQESNYINPIAYDHYIDSCVMNDADPLDPVTFETYFFDELTPHDTQFVKEALKRANHQPKSRLKFFKGASA